MLHSKWWRLFLDSMLHDGMEFSAAIGTCQNMSEHVWNLVKTCQNMFDILSKHIRTCLKSCHNMSEHVWKTFNCLLQFPFLGYIHRGQGGHLGRLGRLGRSLHRHRAENWRLRQPRRLLRSDKRPQDQCDLRLSPWAMLVIFGGDCLDNPPLIKKMLIS